MDIPVVLVPTMKTKQSLQVKRYALILSSSDHDLVMSDKQVIKLANAELEVPDIQLIRDANAELKVPDVISIQSKSRKLALHSI